MPSTANTASVATPNHAAPETRSSVGDHDLKKGFNAREKFHKPLKFHLAVLSILLMVFIVSIDATALAAVIPTIAEEFDGTYLEAFWANASFLLVVTVVLPVYTGLSEVIGRKIPLYVAFFLFTAGSVIFATAQSLPVVIFARALQGSGCGGIDVLNEILVADITTLRERAFYIGLVSVPFALGSVLGPVVGALLGEFASWRWIGWVNLPLVALCLPLSIFCLTLKPLEGSLLQQLARFDWCDLALFVVGAVSLTLPLSWAAAMYPGGSWRTLLPLFVGVAVLGAFVWHESRAARPILPYRLFRTCTAASALALSFLHGMIFYTLIFHLPLFFQSVSLETPLRSSVSFLPFYIILIASTGIAAVGIEWTRQYLWEVWLSWLLLSLGLGRFALWGARTSLAQTAGFEAIVAIGLGSLFTVLPIMMQASTEPGGNGQAVGILVSFRQFGAVVGLAVSDAAFSNQFSRSVAALGDMPPALRLVLQEKQSLGSIARLKELDLSAAELVSIQAAYQQSFRAVFFVLTGLSCVGFLLSFLAGEASIESDENG
ncbi:MFS transporter [Cordyceps militaris]|uniref:MFS transporter n=1 Tax=Cordyceps militaris TaxID=73501 RepID=A0A2H4SE64_CORMI|nr:MFS transporter [Cordyceps militaris]